MHKVKIGKHNNNARNAHHYSVNNATTFMFYNIKEHAGDSKYD